MTEQEIKAYIDKTAKRTAENIMDEFTEKKLLHDDPDLSYRFMSKKLFQYFNDGTNDVRVKKALEMIETDSWIEIIYIYYAKNMTIMQCAEQLKCDVATIVRNKRRIVLSAYEAWEEMTI